MFRSSDPELGTLRNTGHPFFAPRWRGDEVGMVLDADVEWNEVKELVTESSCIQAPKKFVELVDRPNADEPPIDGEV